MAVQANIAQSENWFTGEDKIIQFDAVQSDGSTAQTMTGWALTWELKNALDDVVANVLLSKTVGSGIAIGNGSGTDDRATVTIADNDTEDLARGTYYHMLRRTDAGNEGVLSFGSVKIQDSGLT